MHSPFKAGDPAVKALLGPLLAGMLALLAQDIMFDRLSGRQAMQQALLPWMLVVHGCPADNAGWRGAPEVRGH